jgi:hypothetical protein
MQHRVCSHYATPDHPDHEDSNKYPRLLNRFFYASWKKVGLVTCVFVTLMIGNCTSTQTNSAALNTPIPTETSCQSGLANTQSDVLPAEQAPLDTSLAVPLFLHGDGQESYNGDVGIAIFLPDSTACRVIADMLTKAGLVFDSTNIIIDNIKLLTDPLTQIPPPPCQYANPVSVKVDMIDRKKSVGFTFLSLTDISDLDSQFQCLSPEYPRHNDVTVHTTDIIGVAADIAKSISSKKNGTIGVFYDPITRLNYRGLTTQGKTNEEQVQIFKTIYEESKKESIANLEAQVADFISWLRNKGMLPETSVKRKW